LLGVRQQLQEEFVFHPEFDDCEQSAAISSSLKIGL
jgi:hypothetical protein